MSHPPSFVVRRVLAALLPMLVCAAPASTDGAKATAAFELTPRHRLLYTGQVVDADHAGGPGVEFGVIPPSPIALKAYYNVFTKQVESRPVPGVPHPVPVLRAPHVQLFPERPDPAKLALDQVARYANRVELGATHRFAVVSDGTPDGVRLISFTELTLPQDKTEQWRVRGTIEPLKLVEHVADPVADRGRAVLAKEPLPLTGRLVFATRKVNYGPAELYAVDLPDGRPRKVGDATEPRVAAGTGAVADRVDLRRLQIRDKDGRPVGGVKFDRDEIAEFAIAPDGKSVAVSTERFVEVPDALPRRESVVLVYAADGTKRAEFVNHDQPAFLPDGNLVVLTARGGGPGLFVGDVRTGKVTPIRIQGGPAGQADGGPEWPRWPSVSPDGKRVAYTSRGRAYVVGIDGTGWTPVWESGTQEPQAQPTFSPDGRFVAVVVVPLNVMSGPGQVVVFDLASHVRQPLPATRGADSAGPLVWQP